MQTARRKQQQSRKYNCNEEKCRLQHDNSSEEKESFVKKRVKNKKLLVKRNMKRKKVLVKRTVKR